MSGRCERVFTVRAELGLHARPAGVFVTIAKRFESAIEVSRAEGEREWVDGRSILSLLSLAAAHGVRLCIRAEGADAAAAVETLGHVLEHPETSLEPAAGGGVPV